VRIAESTEGTTTACWPAPPAESDGAFPGVGMAVQLLVWRYRHRSLYWHTTLACV